MWPEGALLSDTVFGSLELIFKFFFGDGSISQTGFRSELPGVTLMGVSLTRSNLLSKLVQRCSKEVLTLTCEALTPSRTRPQGAASRKVLKVARVGEDDSESSLNKMTLCGSRCGRCRHTQRET